jgi:hypothetical protein
MSITQLEWNRAMDERTAADGLMVDGSSKATAFHRFLHISLIFEATEA